MNAVERVEQVTIAAINGVAVGGGIAIALACDLRIAAESARFRIPEVNLGVPLSWGTIPRLVRLVGPAKAKELIMACDWVDANEALAVGLLNKVVPLDKLMECAQEMAEKIATKSPSFLKDSPILRITLYEHYITTSFPIELSRGKQLLALS